MSDSNNNTSTESTETTKAKTVIDDMASRRLFDSVDEATAYIQKCQTDLSDFGEQPIAAVGLTGEGEFDPEIYNDSMRIAVSVLTKRGQGVGSSTVAAIVIYPSPKIEAILADPAGTAWLTAMMEKELNHVAVRNLRRVGTKDGPTFEDAVESMPSTIADYVTSSRDATSGILAVYNDLWQIIKKALGKQFKAFGLANLSKKELRKAIESAGYAAQIYPQLEERVSKKTGEKESLFEIASRFGILLAKEQGLDPAFFERALEDRNERVIDIADDEEEEFDLEAMAAELSADTDNDSGDDEAAE